MSRFGGAARVWAKPAARRRRTPRPSRARAASAAARPRPRVWRPSVSPRRVWAAATGSAAPPSLPRAASSRRPPPARAASSSRCASRSSTRSSTPPSPRRPCAYRPPSPFNRSNHSHCRRRQDINDNRLTTNNVAAAAQICVTDIDNQINTRGALHALPAASFASSQNFSISSLFPPVARSCSRFIIHLFIARFQPVK